MIAYRLAGRLPDFYATYPLVAGLDRYYPDFSVWYWSRAVPSVTLGAGSLVLAEIGGEVVGAALTRSGACPKLRCVRVLPRLAGRGVALGLIDRALRALDCDRPAVTVPEERIHDYSRIFVERYGFRLDRVGKGAYRRGRLEYYFNGRSEPDNPTPY